MGSLISQRRSLAIIQTVYSRACPLITESRVGDKDGGARSPDRRCRVDLTQDEQDDETLHLANRPLTVFRAPMPPHNVLS